MSMNTMMNRRLEVPSLPPNLQVSIERLRELADEDWIAAILYGRASQDPLVPNGGRPRL